MIMERSQVILAGCSCRAGLWSHRFGTAPPTVSCPIVWGSAPLLSVETRSILILVSCPSPF